MVGRDVVGHVVEDQLQPALGQRGPRRGEGGAEARVDDVVAHAVRRADHVLVAQVRQRRAHARHQPRVRRARSPARPGCAPTRPSARRRRPAARRARPTSAAGTSPSVRRPPQPDRGVDLVDRRSAGAHQPAARPPSRARPTAPPSRNSSATAPVQPVWWLAPRPAPLSPWKYSWNRIRSRQCGSSWNFSMPAEHRPAAVLVREERARQPLPSLARDLAQVQLAPGAGRALDLEVVAVVAVQLEQRAQDHEVHREPDRPAPVRVAAEHAGVRLRRQVA